MLLRENPDAVIGMFPSDHVIADEKRYLETTGARNSSIAAGGKNIVVLGIRPNRAETGYGYIEVGTGPKQAAVHVRRFTEKPNAETRAEFVAAGNYFWNSGMFLWSARTLAECAERTPTQDRAAPRRDSRGLWHAQIRCDFQAVVPQVRKHQCRLCCAGTTLGQGRTFWNIFCLPADFGWNDLGSWTALHEHHTAKSTPPEGNLVASSGVFLLNARGNYVHAPGKFVAAVGVTDLVVVETPDALLITTRQHAQDVGKVVKYLDEKKMHKLT